MVRTYTRVRISSKSIWIDREDVISRIIIKEKKNRYNIRNLLTKSKGWTKNKYKMNDINETVELAFFSMKKIIVDDRWKRIVRWMVFEEFTIIRLLFYNTIVTNGNSERWRFIDSEIIAYKSLSDLSVRCGKSKVDRVVRLD